MAFTLESPRTPTALPIIRVRLVDQPNAVEHDGTPVPYKAKYHIQLVDQDGVTMKEFIGDLTDHYSGTELQPLRDFMNQFRADAEAQILP